MMQYCSYIHFSHELSFSRAKLLSEVKQGAEYKPRSWPMQPSYFKAASPNQSLRLSVFLQSPIQSRGFVPPPWSTVRPPFRAIKARTVHCQLRNVSHILCACILTGIIATFTLIPTRYLQLLSANHTYHVRPSLRGLTSFRTTGCCQPTSASVHP